MSIQLHLFKKPCKLYDTHSKHNNTVLPYINLRTHSQVPCISNSIVEISYHYKSIQEGEPSHRGHVTHHWSPFDKLDCVINRTNSLVTVFFERDTIYFRIHLV